MPIPLNDLPTALSLAYQRMREDWQTCRDVFAGTRTIHAAGERYLPKFDRETQKAYQRRSTSVSLYNGFRRTVLALAGMICQRQPTLGADVPQIVRDDWEHIDGLNHGRVFVRHMLRDGLTVGLNGILVDYPTVEDVDSIRLDEEQRLGLRPYWVLIRAEDVLSVRAQRVGGRLMYTQIVIRETTEIEDGAFGTRQRVRYRVFRHDAGGVQGATGPTFEIWEDQVTFESDRAVITTVLVQEARSVRGARGPLSRIPFQPFFAGEQVGPFEAAPPLLDLAELNLDHYRVQVDRRNAITLACTATPVLTGVTDEEVGDVVLGPTSALVLPNPEATASFLEVTGTAFAPTKDELQMIEQHMAAVGIAFLYGETRAAETAYAKELDANAQNSTLTLTVDNAEDALEGALELHCEYRGFPAASITLNREFLKIVMSPDMFARVSDAQMRGQLSLSTLHEIWRQGHVLPDDFDSEAEQERIHLEAPTPMRLPAGSGGDNRGADPGGTGVPAAA
jgi:hypothetical protein